MASNVINYAGMFIIAVFITRMLGVDPLGEFTFIFSFVFILTAVTDLGISSMLVRRINHHRNEAWGIIKSINRFRSILSTGSVAGILIIIYFLPGGYFSAAFAAGLMIVIPKSMQSAYDSSIRALQQQTLPALIKSAVSLLQIVFAYIIMLGNTGLLYVMVMLLVTELFSWGAFYLTAEYLWKKLIPGIENTSPQPVKPLILESLPFFGNNVFALSIPRVTMILLGYTSQSALGIFSAASRFAGGIGLFSGALFNTYYPVMTGDAISGPDRYRLTKKLAGYAFSTGTVIAVLLYAASDLLIGLSFRIPEAAQVLKILSFTVIPVLTYSVLQPYLFALHKEKFILKVYIFLFILNLPAAILLIHYYGYLGAAYVSVIAEILFCCILTYEFMKKRSKFAGILNQNGENPAERNELNEVRKFHDNIAVHYDALLQKNPFSVILRKLFHEILAENKLNNITALDLGCGTGDDAVFLAEHGADVTAVDLSPEMIKEARKKSASRSSKLKIVFECADMESFVENTSGEKYDIIVSNFDAVNYIENTGKFSDNTAHLLNENGIMQLTVLNKICLSEFWYEILTLRFRRAYSALMDRNLHLVNSVKLYYPLELSRLFEKNFKVIKVTGVGIFIPPHNLIGMYKKLKLIIPLLLAAEKIVRCMRPFYTFSDHFIIELQKK
jgi:O-antigen/teichoic acid export membrane protein/2-polyprenyl-3-methyl-5-hydroxy-6-metoxy-1,4-benzoquinol methylase